VPYFLAESEAKQSDPRKEAVGARAPKAFGGRGFKWRAPTRSVGRRPFKPQTALLRWRGLRTYGRAAEALNHHGFVLLIGEPAAGKTTIASMLSMGTTGPVGRIDIWAFDQNRTPWRPLSGETLILIGSTACDRGLPFRGDCPKK
jgi:hypothetical protein